MAPRETSIPADPLAWRPQTPLPTRRPLQIHDPLVEPLWSGTRVMAHVDDRWSAPDGPGAAVRLIDAFGVDLASEEPVLTAAIRAAVLAQDAVIDAILTDQATRGGVGAAIIAEPRVSMMRMLAKQDPTVDVERKDVNADPVEAFVALDLLRLDGQSLLDVPLLERKRLLESVVAESELVRVSVHARPPVDGWVASWKSAGLKGAILKSANSRYVPGGQSHEWRTVTRMARGR